MHRAPDQFLPNNQLGAIAARFADGPIMGKDTHALVV